MVYTFKKNGVRAAVLTRTASVSYLDSLTYDMLEQVTPPLSEELPMGMRYFFAKYDSGDLKKSYAAIRSLYEMDADTSEDALCSQQLTGALIHPEVLGEEKYAALLAEYQANRRDKTAFGLYLCAADPDRIPGWVEKAHAVLGDGLQITLRCPVSVCRTYEGVLRYQAECGRIEDFTGAALPENTEIIAAFSADTDLNAQVTRLLDAGYRLCAVPEAGLDADTACKLYDALSRVLLRRFRNSHERPFTAFAISTEWGGRWWIDDTPAEADLDSMPGGYWQYGWLKHLAGYVSSPAILRCLVENALVLGEKEQKTNDLT